MLESRIKALRNDYKKIWYMADGVYSMQGDFAPIKELYKLADQYEQLHLYIDDIHGMSWAGPNGKRDRASTGSMTLSWKLPDWPAIVTVRWSPITWAQTIVMASGMTGLILPGMMLEPGCSAGSTISPVSYTHLRAHETVLDIVCRLLLEKKKQLNA